MWARIILKFKLKLGIPERCDLCLRRVCDLHLFLLMIEMYETIDNVGKKRFLVGRKEIIFYQLESSCMLEKRVFYMSD